MTPEPSSGTIRRRRSALFVSDTAGDLIHARRLKLIVKIQNNYLITKTMRVLEGQRCWHEKVSDDEVARMEEGEEVI